MVVGDEGERNALALDPELEIAFQDEGTVSWAFRSSATPQAFVVNGEGIVTATGFPNALKDLRELIRRANDPPIPPPALGAHRES